jgi:hypothetical protein
MREMNQGGLATRVRNAAGDRHQSTNRRDIDDPPAVASRRLRLELAGDQLWPTHVGFLNMVPSVRVERDQIRKRDTDIPCRVVDQDVGTTAISAVDIAIWDLMG